MAAAVPAAGGGAAAPPALARMPAVPASTTLAAHPVAPATAVDATTWTLPHDSTVVWSLRFLVIRKPPAAAPVEIESNELGSILLAALKYDSLPAAVAASLATANLMEWHVARAEASRLLSELQQARIFTKRYDNLTAFLDAIAGSTLVDRNVLSFRAATLHLCDPFDTPALGGGAHGLRRGGGGGAAAPARPGPVELGFLRKCTFATLIREGRNVAPDFPGLLLSMVVGLLGPCDRDDTRREEGSQVRLAAATLKAYIAEAERIPTAAGDALFASNLARYLSRLHDSLPTTLSSGTRASGDMDHDLRDAHVLLVGRGAEVESVYYSRIHRHLDAFEVLCHFAGNTAGVGDTRMCLERLTSKYETVAAGLTPLARVSELDRLLANAEKGETVADLFGAGSTAKEVVDELLGVKEAVSAALPAGGAAAASAPEGGSTAAAISGTALSAAALERGMNKAFKETVEQAAGLEGTELLDVCVASTAVLILRFFYMASSFLVTRHDIFGRMAKAMPERRLHLSRSVVTSADGGGVPDHRATYLITVKQESQFCGLQWDVMDMVNHDAVSPETGGFLAVRYLDTACRFSDISAEQHYVTESTLLGIREWFDQLLLGGGYVADPDTGFTWFQVVDKQISLIRYIDGLPEAERPSWLNWARHNFITYALQRACTHAAGILRSHEPGSEDFGAFLPTNVAFFSNIDRRLEDARPVATVRRAFESFMPTAPVQLAGTVAAASSSGGGGGGSGGGSGGGGGGGGGGGAADKRKTKLATMLKSGHLFLAGYTYDVQGAADKLGIDVNSKDWAVMFTNKSGKDRLSVCLDPKHHGGLNTPCHQLPKGFNRTALTKEFAKPATAAEKTEAGWDTGYKGKKARA